MGDRVHYRAGSKDAEEPDDLLDRLGGGNAAGYDSSENDEAQLLPRPGTVSWEDSTEGSLAVKSEYSSVLAGSSAPKRKKNFKVPFGLSFLKTYHAPDGSAERVTPFAVVLLIMLLVVYVLNQADRLVLPVVIPSGLRCGVAKEECAAKLENVTNSSAPISVHEAGASLSSSGLGESDNHTNSSGGKDCIDFSDDEQGLLTGPAFTVIYVLAGLPLARLADTRSRPIVLLVGMIFWSVMVLLTGFAQTFWELLLLRVFLGIGEATCNPVAYSLLADFFPSNHRAFALSVYHYGVYLASSRWKNSKPYVIAVSQLLAAPCIAAVLLAPTPKSSYGLLFLAYLTAETWLGPAAAIVQDICMPAMRAQASAVYIGVITIVASSGPVIVPGILDAMSSFDRCSDGLKIALLMVVPSFYVTSSLLFLVLGLVMQWWEKRSKDKGHYMTFNADDKVIMRPH